MKISVVIPTLNGVGRIERCIGSILSQEIPRDDLELIVVDDASTDETIMTCERLGVDKILTSGHRDIERSKQIGIDAASGELVFFIDDDNQVPDASWLKRAVSILSANPDVAAVQTAFFLYRPEDPSINRYCSLMGLNDPLVYYLGRTDRLAHFETSWCRPSVSATDEGWFWLAKVDPNQLPTLGSQGFLTRKCLLDEFPRGNRFLHLDYCQHLAQLENKVFALTKDSVRHDHCLTFGSFMKKCRRNARIFLADGSTRNFNYDLSLMRRARLAIICLTLVRPLLDSARGFRKIRDVAWFWHPVASLVVFTTYSLMLLRHRFVRSYE